MNISVFPALDASLNAITAILLLLGYFYIRKGQTVLHKICMLLATFFSIVFLICYLYYHFHHGTTRFPGHGLVRPVYFAVLISHTVLAIVNVPLVVMTLIRAFKGQFEKHKKVARITFPVWLYVSVTGVVVYWMLYQIKY